MRLLSVFLVSFGLALFSQNSQAAQFDEFTLFNEVSLGGGTLTQETSGASLSGTAPQFGYRFGIRDHYMIGVIDLRALSFAPEDSSIESSTFYTIGLGVGVEWDIPLRVFYSFDLSMGDFNGGSTELSSSSTIEVSYFLSDTFTVGLQLQSANIETEFKSVFSSVKMTGTFVVVSFPFDIDYPKVSWRNRQD